MIHLRTAGPGRFLPLLFIPPRPERRAEGPKLEELCPPAWGPGPAHQEGEERPLTRRQAAKSPVAVISSDSEISTESESGKASNKPRRRSGPTSRAHPRSLCTQGGARATVLGPRQLPTPSAPGPGRPDPAALPTVTPSPDRELRRPRPRAPSGETTTTRRPAARPADQHVCAAAGALFLSAQRVRLHLPEGPVARPTDQRENATWEPGTLRRRCAGASGSCILAADSGPGLQGARLHFPEGVAARGTSQWVCGARPRLGLGPSGIKVLAPGPGLGRTETTLSRCNTQKRLLAGHPEGPGSLRMSVLGVQGVLGTHNHNNLVRQAARVGT